MRSGIVAGEHPAERRERSFLFCAEVSLCHAAARQATEQRYGRMHLVETPPQRGTRLQLLDTTISDLPPGVADQVARACEPVEDVRAAYIARQLETTEPDGPSVEVLTVAVELQRSPTEPGEPRTREVIRALLQDVPKIGNRKGVAVLAEAALPVWRRRAVRVFKRL